MKRYITIFFTLFALTVVAQSKFGYVSCKDIVESLPEYSVVTKDLNELLQKYEAEIDRADLEFNKKYVEFIEDQGSFPQTILQKRHRELQDLMEKSIQFKEEVKLAMQDAEKEMMAPLRKKVDGAIKQLCEDKGYSYILDLDKNTCLYINPKYGVDVTNALKEALGIKH